jgi:hypothetical protein
MLVSHDAPHSFLIKLYSSFKGRGREIPEHFVTILDNILDNHFANILLQDLMVISFFVSLAVLASGLAFVGPVAQGSMSPELANALYVALRVLVMLAFSFIAVRRFHKNMYHALSFTGLLIFIDHVGVRSLWLAWQYRQNPASWEGAGLFAVLYNNAFAYIVFLPAIMMVSFVGASIGLYLNQKQLKRSGAAI